MFTPSKKHPRATNPDGWGGLFGRRNIFMESLAAIVPRLPVPDPFGGPKEANLSMLQRLKKRMRI
jgi:hypothetical protein